MALVAYDNSDASDFEDEDENVTVVALNKKGEDTPLPSTSKSSQDTTQEEVDNTESLFNLLPQPTTKKITVIEEDDEFLHKKESTTNAVKPKAKITVPSLSDFRDVEDRPTTKPKATSGKKSGLLSLLPQPKNGVTLSAMSTKSFVPHVLTQKPIATAKKKDPLPTPVKKAKTEAKPLVTNYSDDSDNDEEVQNDFFSINKPVELPEDVPLDIDTPSMKKEVHSIPKERKTQNIESYFKQDEVQNYVELQQDYVESSSNSDTGHYNSGGAENSNYSNNYQTQESSSGDAVLDEEAILKLVGARGKRRREDIQIVDVNQQEVLADAREWLLKGLMDDTTKRVSSSKRRGDEPTSQQRRKHQITYLAHQAKANEAELQNQWANNRMSKRQTQSKYGF